MEEPAGSNGQVKKLNSMRESGRAVESRSHSEAAAAAAPAHHSLCCRCPPLPAPHCALSSLAVLPVAVALLSSPLLLLSATWTAGQKKNLLAHAPPRIAVADLSLCRRARRLVRSSCRVLVMQQSPAVRRCDRQHCPFLPSASSRLSLASTIEPQPSESHQVPVLTSNACAWFARCVHPVRVPAALDPLPPRRVIAGR